MPLILASNVPSANSPLLAAICEGWRGGIGARLSGAQKQYINNFGPNAARAKASRILARHNALCMTANNAILDMNGEKKPFFPALPDVRASFCHTEDMSFCLLDNESRDIAIDAEEENSGDIPAMANFLKKMFHIPADLIKSRKIDILRVWLIYECIYKIFGERSLGKEVFFSSGAFNLPCVYEKRFYLDTCKLFFTFFPVGGCLVCAASTLPEAEYEIYHNQVKRINGKFL